MNEIYLIELSNKHEDSSKIGKTAVRLIACEKLGVKSSELEFSLGENGKPYLKSLPDFHFNISHSSKKVAIAISDSPIGIDIEKLRKPNFKIATRFFAENEIDYIGENPHRFFEIWTKKEAYLKFKGTGIKFPINSFDVTENDFCPPLFCFEKNGYIISVCSDFKKECFDIKNITEKELKICSQNILLD